MEYTIRKKKAMVDDIIIPNEAITPGDVSPLPLRMAAKKLGIKYNILMEGAKGWAGKWGTFVVRCRVLFPSLSQRNDWKRGRMYHEAKGCSYPMKKGAASKS